jgi:hypothetical protein
MCHLGEALAREVLVQSSRGGARSGVVAQGRWGWGAKVAKSRGENPKVLSPSDSYSANANLQILEQSRALAVML